MIPTGWFDETALAAMQLIFSFKGSPDESSSRCLTCHVTMHEQALFNRSEHKLQGVLARRATHLNRSEQGSDQCFWSKAII